MLQRLLEELALIRNQFADVEFREAERWFLVRAYPLPPGWNRATTDVAFQANELHPVAPPYGFYVPAGLLYRGEAPKDYSEPAQSAPPYEGSWGLFSWTPDSEWLPRSPAEKGSNLLDWVRSFGARFDEGR